LGLDSDIFIYIVKFLQYLSKIHYDRQLVIIVIIINKDINLHNKYHDIYVKCDIHVFYCARKNLSIISYDRSPIS